MPEELVSLTELIVGLMPMEGIFMAQYEIAVLFDQGLEIDLEKATAKVEKIIADNGGKITNTDNWGKRKLAYPIKGQEFGIYVFYTVEMEGAGVQKINDTLNIT